jgi:hypothetical protein
VVVVLILVEVCKFSKSGGIFSLFQCHHLSIYLWSTWSKSALVVNIKAVHLDMVLDDMERVGQVWLQKQKIGGCNVGKKL